jgi:hypothetical protein
MYNMMTCEGLGTSILGGCSMAWFGLALVLFLALILRRQCDDGFLAGTGYNAIAAFIIGLGAYIVLTSMFGSPRWALLGGIIGVAVGGFGLGMIMDTAGGGE